MGFLDLLSLAHSLVLYRFLLKKKPELNTSGSSARLLEEVLAIERDSSNQLTNCTKVRALNIHTPGSNTVSFYSLSNFFFFFLQYYYSVRILPGQDPSCVWVGWVTSNFHCCDRTFDPDRVCSVTVTLGDQWGKVLER